MLVDDDDGLRANVAELLAAMAGAEVESFSCGVAALAAFTAAPDRFDFIVSDLDMPVMSGIDFAKRVKAIRPKAKILLATGSGIITPEEATGFGFCGMISKPFDVDTLRKVLASARLGAEEVRRTRPSALQSKNHQPNQAGTVAVCMAA